MKRAIRAFKSIGTLWLMLLLGTLGASAAQRGSGRLRVLLLDGESGGPYHHWQGTTPILKKELEETGLFDVTVATAPAWGGDFSGFRPDFSRYQVVVSNLDSPDWPPELKTQFEQYMREGRRAGGGACRG